MQPSFTIPLQKFIHREMTHYSAANKSFKLKKNKLDLVLAVADAVVGWF